MKRFISLVALTIGLLMIFDSCAVGRRKDVVIAYEHLNADASFKQFKKATKTNQIEILSALVRRANDEYLKCQTIDDLYAVMKGAPDSARSDMTHFNTPDGTERIGNAVLRCVCPLMKIEQIMGIEL